MPKRVAIRRAVACSVVALTVSAISLVYAWPRPLPGVKSFQVGSMQFIKAHTWVGPSQLAVLARDRAGSYWAARVAPFTGRTLRQVPLGPRASRAVEECVPVISPDGMHFLSTVEHGVPGSEQFTASVVDITTDTTLTWKANGAWVCGPVWFPGGDKFVVVARVGKRYYAVVASIAEPGRSRAIPLEGAPRDVLGVSSDGRLIIAQHDPPYTSESAITITEQALDRIDARPRYWSVPSPHEGLLWTAAYSAHDNRLIVLFSDWRLSPLDNIWARLTGSRRRLTRRFTEFWSMEIQNPHPRCLGREFNDSGVVFAATDLQISPDGRHFSFMQHDELATAPMQGE